MLDIINLVAYSALIALLFSIGELLRTYMRLPAETTRKMAHITCGLIGLSFAYGLQSGLAIGLICLLFCGVLLYTQIYKNLESIHGIDRISWGAVLFPASVAISYFLTQYKMVPAVYPAAILVLTLADPAAAMGGSVLPITRFGGVFDGKSLGGSLSFFLIALGSLAGIQYFVPMPNITFGVLLAMAGSSTAAELLGRKGTDNLFIPLACIVSYYLLN